MEHQNPHEKNLQISLLKNNLDIIKNEFIDQHSEISSLNASTEQCYQQAMFARRKEMAFYAKVERRKAVNIQFQLKRQAQLDKLERVRKEVYEVCRTSDDIQSGLQQDQEYQLCQLRKYDDAVRELADRYRKASAFYDQVEIKKQIESDEKILSELQIEQKREQKTVAELRSDRNNIKAQPSVPENILDIIGQKVLTNKLNALSVECENVRANIIR